MLGGRPPAFNPFTCPNCSGFYQVVKAEAGPETDNREIACRVCGSPLAGVPNGELSYDAAVVPDKTVRSMGLAMCSLGISCADAGGLNTNYEALPPVHNATCFGDMFLDDTKVIVQAHAHVPVK
jgi:hypothetical protein